MEEFHDLTSLVAELRLHPHVPAKSVQIDDIDEIGNCNVTYQCRKCGATNSINAWFWFTETCLCTLCGVKNEVDPFRTASYQHATLCKNLAVDLPIALWGAGGLYYKLMQQYDELADERFLLIDTNPEKHGLKICGKTVNHPDIIADKGINTVIIMALSRKEEIQGMFSVHYPSVEKILIPAFESFGNTIVPVFNMLQTQPTGSSQS